MNVKISYNTLVYAGENIADGIRRLAKFGYDGVDFVGEPDQFDTAEICRLLKENNIEASSICAIFTNERDFVSDDPVIRKQAVEYMKKCVDFSVAIGAKSISTQVTANMKIDADAPFETAWKWAVEGLKEAGEYALKNNIRLTLEAWNRYETYLITKLDEPTSSLSEREVRTLFKLIAKLKKEGISIIYISHRMEEIFEIGDRVTVFRDGEKIDTLNIKDTTEQKLIQLMIGREFKENYSEYKIDENREIVLEAENVITSKYKDPISFKAYKGEITGIFGLVGAGRTELARVLFGIDRSPCGTIKKDGKVLNLKSAKDAINNKIGMVPEDRKQLGLVLKHNVQDNLTVVKLKDLPWLLKSDREEAQITDHYINALSIATRGGQQIVGRLSGGNQQKVVISKWLSLDLDVLILDEPTRGVDVKAKAEIYDIMRKLADQGVSIIMISSDLPEILRVSHRVIVMHDGKITLDGQTKDYDQEKIMHAAIS